MDKYDVTLNGVVVKTRVVGHSSMVEHALDELRAQLLVDPRVVGINLGPMCQGYHWSDAPCLLVLQAGCSCVIFQLKHIGGMFPKAIKNFLLDQTICFVGVETDYYVTLQQGTTDWWSIPKVRLGELAARVLKNPNLSDSGNLENIARAVGLLTEVPYSPSSSLIQNYGALAFSAAEITELIKPAYACHVMGNKLLSML